MPHHLESPSPVCDCNPKPQSAFLDPVDDDLLTFAQAAKLCPVEVAPHSVWRWARKGLTSRSGETVRLEHVRVGRRIFIPRDALGRFFEAVALSDTRQESDVRQRVPSRDTKRPPSQRKRAYESAMRELGVDE